jgi:hypothetical protein
MFSTLNQTAQTKTQRAICAHKKHPRTATHKPANSNRDTKLLEIYVTTTKHSPATHSNRDKKRFFTFAPAQTAQVEAPEPRRLSRPQTHIKKNRKLEENANRHPQFLFRLERSPIDCFQGLTPDFNRTHVSVRTHSSTATPGCVGSSEMIRYRAEANDKPQPKVAVLLMALHNLELTEKSRERGKNTNQHPQFLFRSERGRIVCFQGLTHGFK